jgi:hypothetical protein
MDKVKKKNVTYFFKVIPLCTYSSVFQMASLGEVSQSKLCAYLFYYSSDALFSPSTYVSTINEYIKNLVNESSD